MELSEQTFFGNLAIDLAAIAVLAYGIYFRRHRWRDLLMACVTFNVAMWPSLPSRGLDRIFSDQSFGVGTPTPSPSRCVARRVETSLSQAAKSTNRPVEVPNDSVLGQRGVELRRHRAGVRRVPPVTADVVAPHARALAEMP
jgi:hypothetical protein